MARSYFSFATISGMAVEIEWSGEQEGSPPSLPSGTQAELQGRVSVSEAVLQRRLAELLDQLPESKGTPEHSQIRAEIERLLFG